MDGNWNREKLISFIQGFGTEVKALKGKRGKICPTDKLVSYINEAFENELSRQSEATPKTEENDLLF